MAYRKQTRIKQRSYSFFCILTLVILKIVVANLGKMKDPRYLNVYDSVINLVIQGNGTQQFLGNEFDILPTEVIINGVKNNSCTKSCLLERDINNITLIFQDQIESLERMFKDVNNLIEIDLSNFDTSKVTNMFQMFSNCLKLISVDLSDLNTQNLCNISYMFINCTNLETVNYGNINISSLLYMNHLFYNCSNLKSIDLSKFNTSKITSMLALFYECSNLKSVNFGNIDTSSVKNMRALFYGCSSLININLSNFNTSKVTDMKFMFRNCKSLISIDLSNFDFSQVKDMSFMLQNCYNLEILNFGYSISPSLENMEAVFYNCSNLKSIDLSKLDTSKVKTMYIMFQGCSNLESINFGNINTSSLENMRSLFNRCYKLTSLNLSNFDTSKVIDFQWVFYQCTNLKYLDLSSFTISTLSDVTGMFHTCKSLIYLNLYSFQFNNTLYIKSAFTNIPTYTKICVNDIYSKNYLLENDKISICSDTCYNENNIKADIIYNMCLESCTNVGSEYDYKNICYSVCPNGTQPILFPGNNFVNNTKQCLEQVPQDYYLDLNDRIYKKCYETCKSCYGKGNETFNNCIECKSNFTSHKNQNNITNCYLICGNYYYFDNFNNYYCTDSLECPIQYSKLIENKNKCIGECKNDDIYKYEYKNICYQECPNNTLPDVQNNYICNDRVAIERNPSSILFSGIKTDISLTSIRNSTFFETIQSVNIYQLINNENITQKIISTLSQSHLKYECQTIDSLNDNCNFLDEINNTAILDFIKDNIQSLYNPDEGKSKVIKGEDGIIFQITNTKNELELLKNGILNNQNLSIFDLGQCEGKLKKEYNINERDSLIYLKQENINNKASERNIQYEVLEPYNFTKLDLSICKDETINIYVKIDLSEETKKTYEYIKSMGHNMFDINDPFYHDICIPYTSENNTDMLLSDRIDYIYNNKDSQCQSNCVFSSHVINSSYINCTCSVVEVEENNEKKFNGKKLYESFYDILKYSNFRILKCYKLVFNNNIFKKNIGNYIILSIISFFCICLLFYIIRGIVPLKNQITIFISKNKEKNDNKDNSNKNNNNLNFNQIQIYNNKIFSPPKGKHKDKNQNKKNNSGKKSKKRNSRRSIPKINDYNESSKPHFHKNKSISKNNYDLSSKIKLAYSENVVNNNKAKNLVPKNEGRNKVVLDAFELRELEYDEAILLDQRSFMKTYWDILRREHIIIFTFFICNDYNLLYIKYAKFLFLIATDMALNVFFFSDESMHKVFLNYGKYNFIQQIPQIIYTTIFSQLIEVFLCFLSLTDKHIYLMKNSAKLTVKNDILKILRCIKVKLIIFFIFTFIFFVCYWYIVCVFCAVYENTQIIYLKDSLSSFLLGMIYPFILYIFPTALRVISLRHSKKDCKCIYKMSDIIPFF